MILEVPEILSIAVSYKAYWHVKLNKQFLKVKEGWEMGFIYKVL